MDLSGEKTRKRSRSWSGKKMEVEKLPTLEAGERKAVLVTHDESTMEVSKFLLVGEWQKEDFAEKQRLIACFYCFRSLLSIYGWLS